MTSKEQLLEIFLSHPKVVTDSRKISAGSIFFALKGENFDGNQFAQQALEKGAAYAVIDDAKQVDDDERAYKNSLIFIDNDSISL